MSNSLNFRSFTQPTLKLTMNDAAETALTVIAPSVELVERLKANQAEIVAALTAGGEASLAEVWKLAADLISCNREGVKVTVADLKGRYGISYKMLLIFFKTYEKFINEIEAAKN